MPVVESQHIEQSMAFGEHDDRRISQSDTEIPIFLDDKCRGCHVFRTELFQPISPASDLLQQHGLLL